ncbi:cellulose binding domain-containing protein [Eubacterium xylanophilum]|uniref:cellulose binding domain-containing protein n=1 Tax=Eubacterium xylanophilum TaxID=39497 RepID=UPI00047DD090|nr:cellulose binding domain-containing protein [Eubacterium xylanophilum]
MKKIKMYIVILLIICLEASAINVASSKAIENSMCKKDVFSEINKDQVEESGKVDFIFSIESEWKNHYNGLIRIKNTSVSDVENWKISFVTSDKIEHIWCGEIVSHESDTYVVKNLGWNQDIKAGGEVNFGFTAYCDDEKDIPHDFYISQECTKVNAEHSINYRVISEWDTGLNGEIIIHNDSEEKIEDWKLTFDCTSKISCFWTADIDSTKNNTYFIDNRGYNSNIQPDENIVLGFNVIKENPNEVFEIDNFQLYCMDVYKEDTNDADEDGLYDNVEKSIGSNPNQEDSDGDGLNDYQEVEILGLNPLSMDSDNDGISDFNEDYDGDGLSNGEEITAKCNPIMEDSDGDRLNDFEEMRIYNTNPNEIDTDGDMVDDFVEVRLGINPLLKDTDDNGILDADEKIEQNYHADMDFGEAGSLDFFINTNLYLEDELEIDCSEEEISVENYDKVGEGSFLNLEGSLYTLDGDVVETATPATIKFNLNTDANEIKVYYHDGERFKPIEYYCNKEDNSIIVHTKRLEKKYFLSCTRSNSDSSRRVRLKAKKRIKYSKANLIKDIKKDFEKEKGLKTTFGTYTVTEAVNIVLRYDSEITAAAKKYKVKKEMIQSIITRELICIWAQDAVVDGWVANYYHNKREIEYYMSLEWWKQLLYGTPNCIYPQREDSSTGIGQIYAKTAINATNYLGETNIKYGDWKKRKIVWYNLKDDKKYSAVMVAKVLRHIAKKENISSPTKNKIKNVAAFYNASTVKKGAHYGKKIYKYNKWFTKYNKNS